MSSTLILPTVLTDVTLLDVQRIEPLWTKQHVAEFTGFFADTPHASIEQLLESEISTDLKLTLLLRPEFFAAEQLRFMACDFAEEAHFIFKRVYPFDDLTEAIEASRAFANGWCDDWQLEPYRLHLAGPNGLIHDAGCRLHYCEYPAPIHRCRDAIDAAIHAVDGDAYLAWQAADMALDFHESWALDIVRKYVDGGGGNG